MRDGDRSIRSVGSSVMRGLPSPGVYEAKNSKRLSMLKAVEQEMSGGFGTDLSAIQSYLDARNG